MQALQRQRLHVWSVRDARSVVGAFALRDNTLRCFYSRFAEKGTEARRNARLLPQENRHAPLCGRPSQLCGAERRTRRSVLCYCKALQAARGPLRPVMMMGQSGRATVRHLRKPPSRVLQSVHWSGSVPGPRAPRTRRGRSESSPLRTPWMKG